MSQEIKIRKLNTEQERFQAERLLATSFLHDWNEKEAQESGNYIDKGYTIINHLFEK